MPNHINGSHVNFCNPIDEITCVIARQEPQSKREGKAAHADADSRERGTRCFTHTSPRGPGKVARRPLMRIRQSCSAASYPDENQGELLRRVVPDENQAELLRRVAPDENQAKSLCTSLPMSIAAASPRCSARYENRVTPRPIRKTIPPSGLTGKNDTPETIPTDFPRKFHRRGQTTNLPRGKMRSKSRSPKANG